MQSEWLNSFCLFNQSFHIKSKEHLYLLQIWVSWQTDLIRPCFLPDVEWHAIQAGLASQMDEIACGAFQLPPPPSVLILGGHGGASYCIWVPERKVTLSLWRQLLKSGMELTGGITVQLCSKVQSRRERTGSELDSALSPWNSLKEMISYLLALVSSSLKWGKC